MCVQIAALSGSTCCTNISTLFNTSSIYSPQRRIKYYCIIVIKLMLLLQPNSPPFALLLLLFVVVSPIQRVGCQPEKLLYTVANPARGLLNREKRTKEKVWQHTPPPHPPYCSFGENKLNHATHLQALRRSWSASRSYKDTFGSSTRPMGVASQNSTLPSAIISFPVSFLLSSPGDV